MTRLLSLFVDAWEQLKLQRVRVLMSLIGVTVAVAALTSSIALGNIMSRVNDDMMLRSSGPPATYTVSVSGVEDSGAVLETFEDVTGRYGISYASPLVTFDPMIDASMMYPTGYGVHPSYFAMHALDLVEGRSLRDQDADRLAPVAVISEALAEELGIGSTVEHPTIPLQDGTEVLVVGIIANRYPSEASLYVMAEIYFESMQTAEPQQDPWFDAGSGDMLEFRVSVPAEGSLEFARRIVSDLRAELPDARVAGYRVDAGAYADMGPDPGFITTLVLGAVSVAILALGALSLVNIAVVTVRYRIREFGIRRAFGASRRRIFLGVMMESIVGTFVAGVIGVGIVAVLYRSPVVGSMFEGIGLTALPPFPVEAAVIGILTSIATGALAGMIPALIAVRSKVIDAIRF